MKEVMLNPPTFWKTVPPSLMVIKSPVPSNSSELLPAVMADVLGDPTAASPLRVPVNEADSFFIISFFTDARYHMCWSS